MPESSVPLLPPFAVSSTAPSLLFSPSYCGGMRGGGKVPAKTIDAARPFWKPKTPNFEGKLLCVCPIISGCFFLGGRRPVLRYEAISHFYCPPLHASLRKNLFHRRLSAAAQACIGEEEEEEVRFYCCLLSPSLPLPQVERQERRNRKKTPGGNRRGGEEEEEECNGTTCETLCLPSAMLRLHQPKGGGGEEGMSVWHVCGGGGGGSRKISPLSRRRRRATGEGPFFFFLPPLSLLRSKWEKPCSC